MKRTITRESFERLRTPRAAPPPLRRFIAIHIVWCAYRQRFYMVRYRILTTGNIAGTMHCPAATERGVFGRSPEPPVALVTARIRQTAMTRPTATAPWHSFASEEFRMTDTANHLVPEQGRFRRALAAVISWVQALDNSSFDYTLDRIEHLEREVGRLKEELRQSRDPRPIDAHQGRATGLEH